MEESEVYQGRQQTQLKHRFLREYLSVLHAAYAPYVDIFTCDRRTEGPLRRALANQTMPRRILRATRLEDIADACVDLCSENAQDGPVTSSAPSGAG